MVRILLLILQILEDSTWSEGHPDWQGKDDENS